MITADLGTLCEEVDDGVDGLLYSSRDARSLAKAMLKLIENRDLLQRMSVNMRMKAEKRSWPNIAVETSRLYANLVRL